MADAQKAAPKSFRSANDEKVMATSQVNSGDNARTVEADMTTINATENSPIKAYYEFPQSNVKSVETYSKRMDKIASFLGNKDEVKG